ncbi:hypothetical protein N7494_001063 [Penicillium frequentans]|uniref:Uncharacterized protein n=1 Tax=Penicillium frequentans TaxID=3151616 RepID=A0AAD6GLW5_9EURO|nr:hypothetical protein N7494_001063 [Penicillium glabrum]
MQLLHGAGLATIAMSLGAAAYPYLTVSPKALYISNPEEAVFLDLYNFTRSYTVEHSEYKLACTEDNDATVGTQSLGQHELGLLMDSPWLNLTTTYILQSGTGGVNPKYGTLGGVVLSNYTVMFDFANLFLVSDIPANFSEIINEYPSLVGYEVFDFNNDLLERFYTLSRNVTLLEVNPTLQWYRTLYQYDVARQPPSVTKGASESSNFWWSGDVAAANVEYYVDLLTNGTAN